MYLIKMKKLFLSHEQSNSNTELIHRLLLEHAAGMSVGFTQHFHLDD